MGCFFLHSFDHGSKLPKPMWPHRRDKRRSEIFCPATEMWSSQMVLVAKKKSKKSPSNKTMRESWLDALMWIATSTNDAFSG
jgi:hypothetical protein